MPGLFLEFSILLANPALASQLALRFQEVFAPGRYLALLVGLFLAFVIGNALMSATWFILKAVDWVYRIDLFLWQKFEKHVLLPRLSKLTHTQGYTPPRWVSALYGRTFKNVDRATSTEPTSEYLWWEAAARRLLLKRYGLSEQNLPPTSFGPLQKILTLPTPEELRGSIHVHALHATGWAALIASYFAPTLRAKWYIAFAVFLIADGLLHDYHVAKYLNDPDLGDIFRLQAVLREFPKIQPTGTVPPTPEPHGEDEP